MKHDVAKTISIRIVAIAGLAVAYLIGVLQNSAVSAQENSQSRPETSPAIDRAAGEEFLDAAVPELLQRWQVPGASIAVVKDGETLVARGFGLAAYDQQVPVDPDKSLFRIGSVTKLFTWTAVIQLVEEGKLDLDTDINEYLSAFQIPAAFSDPITLADLMSHSAGFEDRGLIGALAHNMDGVVPLEQYLIDNMPKRVRPAGQVSAYSNYGGALAGHIVSEVSGLPYEQYVRDRIFRPLGMTNATASQSAGETMASSHRFRQGTWQMLPFAPLIPVPEGGISASASSMSRFMIAHLEGGKFRGNVILTRQSIERMHRQSFTHHPDLHGWAHGFQENTIHGFRALEHGGYLHGFSSYLVLIPSQRLGIFVSFNSSGGSAASRELRTQFFDKFLPTTPAVIAPPTPASFDSDKLSGYFTPCRSASTTIAKLGTLMQAVPVTIDDNHSVSFLGRNWIPCKQDLMRSSDGSELLATGKDEQGEIEFLFMGITAWQKLPWYQSPVFQLPLLAGCLLMFLSAIVAWPIGFLVTRNKRARRPTDGDVISRHAGRARWTAAVCSLLNLVFVTALALILSSDTSALEFGVPVSLRLLLVLPMISLALAVTLLVCSIASWKRNWWGLTGRIHYTFVSTASLVFVWFLGFWNLIGWNF